jgi:hypothetical protein
MEGGQLLICFILSKHLNVSEKVSIYPKMMLCQTHAKTSFRL